MKLCLISDCHGEKIKNIPKCDLLLNAGDFSPNKYGPAGRVLDAYYQYNWMIDEYFPWLETLKAKHIVQIAGNHEFVQEQYNIKKMPWPKNTTYLENETVVIDGLKIYGNPYSLFFYNWGFQATRENGEGFLKQQYDLIEDNTDVILCHQPPYGYGDKTIDGDITGSRELLKVLDRVKPKLLVCGHIHEGYSINKYFNTTLVNASILDERYVIKNKPVIFEI